MARKERQEPVYARALVLAPLAGPGAEYVVHATLLIELPDGTLTVGHPHGSTPCSPG